MVAALAVAMLVDRGDDTDVEAGSGPAPSVSVAVTTMDGSTPTSADSPDDPATTVATVPLPPAHAAPPLASFENQGLRLEPTIEIPLLTGMVWNPDEEAYFAISQDGKVFRVDEALTASELSLDLTSAVTKFERYSERGLLGIAFDPGDGRMFLHYNDPDSQTHVVSYAMADGAPDPGSRREVLVQEQPGVGHKGGQIAFDSSRNLYLALGDGGGSNGRDAQDTGKRLGAIVRVLPKPDGDGYTIPAGNPFVDTEGVLPEIYAKGLRNPWRFSIDPPTGDIWIGDVGESTYEEIDKIPAGTAGQNFGWYFREGANDAAGDAPEGLTDPVFEYRHDEIGPAVIGGFVYHGDAIPALQGAYIFADMSGPMFALGANNEGVRLDVTEQTNGVITSFVVTPDNELLVITQNAAIYRVLPA